MNKYFDNMNELLLTYFNTKEECLFVSKNLTKKTNIEVAVFLAEIIRKWNISQDLLDKEGFFPYEQKEIEGSIMMSSFKQSNCVKKLEELNLIETKLKGIPARKYYKPNLKNILLICGGLIIR